MKPDETVAAGPRRRSEFYPRVTRDELDDQGQALLEAILAGPRREATGQFPIEAADGTLEGPFGIFLFSPAIGAPLQELGARLRTSTALSPRQRELATLAIAAELGSEFELRAHVPLARHAGVTDDELAAVLRGDELDDERDQALVRFCRANAVSTAPRTEFGELARHFDRRAVFEAAVLVAYYRGLASLLDLFEIAVPDQADAVKVAVARPTLPAGRDRDLALLREEREISRLLVALARCVDTFDFDGLARLYADDGELVTPWGSHRGRVGLADYVRKDIGKFPALHHVSAGHEIDVVPGSRTARARMTLLATHVNDAAGTRFELIGGHYDIELVRERGAWRLRRVSIVPAWRFDHNPAGRSRPGRRGTSAAG